MEQKNLAMIKFLISEGANVSAQNNSALIIAAEQKDLSMIKFLVSKGADFRAQNNEPIKKAINNCDYNIVRYILSQGKLDNYDELISLTIGKKSFCLINYMLKEHRRQAVYEECDFSCDNNTINCNSKSKEKNKDETSAKITNKAIGIVDNRAKNLFNNIEDVKIISNIANVKLEGPFENKEDNIMNSNSPKNNKDTKMDKIDKIDDETLINAFKQNNQELVKKYLINGANIHAANDYLIRNSIEITDVSFTEFLIERGADTSANNYEAFTKSATKCNLQKYKILNGTTLMNSQIHNEALIALCDKSHLFVDRKPFIQYLFNCGANASYQNYRAIRNSLHYCDQTSKMLIESCKNTLPKDNNRDHNCFVLSTAVIIGTLQMVRYLVDCGIDACSHNNRAICNAAEYSNLDMVKYLVSKGADIHANDDEPLRKAVEKSKYDIVKYILDKGNVRDLTDFVKIAETNGDFILLRILREYQE